MVHSSPQQKILDRADDWWGVEAGVAELPAVERFILLPDQGEQQLVQTIIKNEVDFTTGIQPSSWPTVLKGNPKATSWTGSESPVRLCRLVAALALREQRGGAVERPECALGA